MSIYVRFCVVLTILLSTISQAFYIQNHHKYSKYHRNNIHNNKNHAFFESAPNYHISAKTLLQPHQIDIRGTFTDIPFAVSQETRAQTSGHQCNFRREDFASRNAYCTWNNELIIVRDNQYWCIGYLPGSPPTKAKKTGVLSLKFDRSYQVGYVRNYFFLASFLFFNVGCPFSRPEE